MGVIVQQSADPRIGYEFIPRTSVMDYGNFVRMTPVKISINSLGFRDREYSMTKEERTRRILALGDSDTFGMGVEMDQSFPKILENLLQGTHHRGGKETFRYEVINMGVYGYNTRQEVSLLEEKGIQLHPDLVIITFGENDYLGAQRFPSRVTQWLIKRSAAFRYVHFSLEMRGLVRTDFKDPLLGLHNVLNALQDLAALSATYHFGVIVSFLDHPSPRTPIVQDACRRLHFDVIDMWRFFDALPLRDRLLPDQHPSPLAHKVIARELFHHLRRSYPEYGGDRGQE